MGNKKRSKSVSELKKLQTRFHSEKQRLERKIKAFGANSDEAIRQIERVKRIKRELETKMYGTV